MEGELIFVAIIMQVGTILTIFFWSNLSLSKYFKKENFKTNLTNIRAENKIKLKKLERELGLTISKNENPEPPSTIGQLSQLSHLLPLLKNLDGDQIGALVDKFLGGEELLPAESGGILDQIPPELIESFLKGLSKENVTGEEGGKKTGTGFTGQV